MAGFARMDEKGRGAGGGEGGGDFAADVAGLAEAKTEVMEIVDFLNS